MMNAIDKALAAAGIDPAATAATMAAEHAAERARDAAPAMLAALEKILAGAQSGRWIDFETQDALDDFAPPADGEPWEVDGRTWVPYDAAENESWIKFVGRTARAAIAAAKGESI